MSRLFSIKLASGSPVSICLSHPHPPRDPSRTHTPRPTGIVALAPPTDPALTWISWKKVDFLLPRDHPSPTYTVSYPYPSFSHIYTYTLSSPHPINPSLFHTHTLHCLDPTHGSHIHTYIHPIIYSPYPLIPLSLTPFYCPDPSHGNHILTPSTVLSLSIILTLTYTLPFAVPTHPKHSSIHPCTVLSLSIILSHAYTLSCLIPIHCSLSLIKVYSPYPSIKHIHTPYHVSTLSIDLSLSKPLDLIHHSLIYTYSYIHPTMSHPYPSISLSLKSIVHIHQSNTYIHSIMSHPYPLFSLSH